MPKLTPINFRPAPELKDALQRAAEADGRSVSSLVHKIVMDWLVERGWLKEAKQ